MQNVEDRLTLSFLEIFRIVIVVVAVVLVLVVRLHGAAEHQLGRRECRIKWGLAPIIPFHTFA
jgi:hypothetical protein